MTFSLRVGLLVLFFAMALVKSTSAKDNYAYTGLDQLEMLFSNGQVLLNTIAGAEATSTVPSVHADILQHGHFPVLWIPHGVAYFVVDDPTGLIIANGFGLSE